MLPNKMPIPNTTFPKIHEAFGRINIKESLASQKDHMLNTHDNYHHLGTAIKL